MEPSTCIEGMLTQSPICSRSSAVIWIPDTSPNSGSLKTIARIAANADIPDMRTSGFCPISTDTAIVAKTTNRKNLDYLENAFD